MQTGVPKAPVTAAPVELPSGKPKVTFPPVRDVTIAPVADEPPTPPAGKSTKVTFPPIRDVTLAPMTDF